MSFLLHFQLTACHIITSRTAEVGALCEKGGENTGIFAVISSNNADVAQTIMLSTMLLQSSLATTMTRLEVGAHDFILAGGASLVLGHGAPTGMALRSGSPGQHSAAAFPKLVLSPAATVTEVSFVYRYVTGYGAAGVGHGSNVSLYVSDETLRAHGTVVYSSPHYTEYAYSHNSSNYSKPVFVHAKGLSIRASAISKSRLQFAFANNDKNLQLLVPLEVNVTCTGVHSCFVPTPPPPPPLPPLPPAPIPPATHAPWKSIGPWNIGDDIHIAGEAGTIAPAISSLASPDVMYMG